MKGGAPGERAVGEDAQREDVGAVVDRLAARLLGRHVAGRADGHLLGQRAARIADARHAEVQHLPQAPTSDFDGAQVLRLEIAVHDAGRVGDHQRFGDLGDQIDGVPCRQTSVLAQVPAEVVPVQPLHDEIRRAVDGLAAVEDLDDGRRVKRAAQLRFPLESLHLHRFVTDDEWVQHLECDVLAAAVLGGVDLAHGAASDHLADEIGSEGLAREATELSGTEHAIQIGAGFVQERLALAAPSPFR